MKQVALKLICFFDREDSMVSIFEIKYYDEPFEVT